MYVCIKYILQEFNAFKKYISKEKCKNHCFPLTK